MENNLPAVTKDNEQSYLEAYPFWTVLPLPIKTAIKAIPEDIAEMAEPDLEGVLYKTGNSTTRLRNRPREMSELHLNQKQMDDQIRERFYMEFTAAVDQQRMMMPAHIYGGICSRNTFYNKLLLNPERVAWMICPIGHFE